MIIEEDLLFEAIQREERHIRPSEHNIISIPIIYNNSKLIRVIIDMDKQNIKIKDPYKYESFTFIPTTSAIFDYFKLKYA